MLRQLAGFNIDLAQSLDMLRHKGDRYSKNSVGALRSEIMQRFIERWVQPPAWSNAALIAQTMGIRPSAAFQHKANVLNGEHMPDPRTDSSFKKYVRDDDFIRLMKNLGYE